MLGLCWGATACAQENESAAIIAELAEAYGGAERLEAINEVEIDWVGYFHARFQSRHTEPPYDRIPTRTFLYLDYQAKRGVEDRISAWAGDLSMGNRFIYSPGQATTLNTIEKIYTPGGMAEMHGFSSAVNAIRTRQGWAWVRHLIENPRDDLTRAGKRALRGMNFDTIQYSDGEVTIYLHPQTGLIHAVTQQPTTNMMGSHDDMLRIYDQYFQRDGIWVNRRARYYRSGQSTGDYLLSALDFSPEDTKRYFAVPSSFALAEDTSGYDGSGWDIQTIRIADGVWLAGNGDTRILYVDTGEYWVATEAGGMPSYARETYEAMQAHMGGEPLRYIVPTHHHDDHAIAVKFYSQIGATILTTRDKEGELRQLLARTVDGMGPQDDASFEFIEGETLELDSGGTTYRALVYANAPHTENMILGYVPEANAIFQADIWIGFGGAGPRQGAGYAIHHFNDWIEAKQRTGEIGPIERYLAVHGSPMSAEQFRGMLARPRTVTALPDNEEWLLENWADRYGLGNDTVGNAKRDNVVSDPALR